MTDLEFTVPFGDWVQAFVDWLVVAASGLFDVITFVFRTLYEVLYAVLSWPPNWLFILGVAVLALVARGWRLAVGAIIGLAFIISVDQWDNAMRTLALVLVASGIAVVIAVPVGIWAARSDAVSRAVRPVLDFFQTMPAMVYLVPAIILFGTGVVPGIFATIIFAIAPGVRMTELGIRGVDREVIEAARAFGSTEGRILRQVQLPLALPSIMAGVNQVIMLSLSMVVIAGMVGASGLGQQVNYALGSINVGLGFEAGLSVVVLAMLLDRFTGAVGARRGRRTAEPADEPAAEAADEPADTATALAATA